MKKGLKIPKGHSKICKLKKETTQWPKEKGQTTIHKTKDRVRNPSETKKQFFINIFLNLKYWLSNSKIMKYLSHS